MGKKKRIIHFCTSAVSFSNNAKSQERERDTLNHFFQGLLLGVTYKGTLRIHVTNQGRSRSEFNSCNYIGLGTKCPALAQWNWLNLHQ